MNFEISVIIRSMSRPWLTEALASAANQNIAGLEIVVVDAVGSNHMPLPQLRTDALVRLVSKGRPLSRAAAANFGIDLSQGKSLIFLDDDDLFLEGHLTTLRQALESHPEAVASHTGVRVADATGQEIDVYNKPYAPSEALSHNVLPIHAVLFRREVTQDCRFDESLEVYEDWDFWLQLSQKGPFVHCDGVTAVYRAHLGTSGLSLAFDENLQQLGRVRIYEKWKGIWSGRELNTGINRLLKEIDRLKQERDELERLLLNTDSALLCIRNDLNEANRRWMQAETKGSRLEQELADLEAEKIRLQRNENELKRELLELESENKRLREECILLERNRDHCQRHFQAVVQSTSWRVTAPFRYVVNGFKALLRHSKASGGNVVSIPSHGLVSIGTFKHPTRGHLDRFFPNFLEYRQGDRPGTNNVHSIHSESRPVTEQPPFPVVSLEEILPATIVSCSNVPTDLEVDVIVPIYDGIETTRRCIDRLLNAEAKIRHRIIFIDDASPRQEIRTILATIPRSERIIVFRNEINQGFVATVNKGMDLSMKNDVILLNSDTEVPKGWLDRLVFHAYRSPEIGTVTPFSNNATICSYPNPPGHKTLPDGETLGSLDQAAQCANHGRQVDLPTAVGFCMYIKRNCLNDIGLFDVETFGRGYGEENDFCLRASERGWRHVLAADLFVFHAGGVSFGDAGAQAKDRALAILQKRYPAYLAKVAEHVARDPARTSRLAMTAARFRNGSRPVVLVVSHRLDGTIDEQVKEFSQTLSTTGAVTLILRFIHGSANLVSLELDDPIDGFAVCLTIENEKTLATVLDTFGVKQIYLHHTMSLPIDILASFDRLGRPLVTIGPKPASS
jgi:GT2 family glycosyltransferase